METCGKPRRGIGSHLLVALLAAVLLGWLAAQAAATAAVFVVPAVVLIWYVADFVSACGNFIRVWRGGGNSIDYLYRLCQRLEAQEEKGDCGAGRN